MLVDLHISQEVALPSLVLHRLTQLFTVKILTDAVNLLYLLLNHDRFLRVCGDEDLWQNSTIVLYLSLGKFLLKEAAILTLIYLIISLDGIFQICTFFAYSIA